MPKNNRILKSDEDIASWFAETQFNGNLEAAKKHIRSWRRAWSQNGNRFRAGDEVLLKHKRNILGAIKKSGKTIAQLQTEFGISINHIKRILAELSKEAKITRIREGKAFIYLIKKSRRCRRSRKKILKR